jgi:hypothetical protein
VERTVRGRPVLLPGAIDSIANLAPKDIEGVEAARKAVADADKATVEAWRTDDQRVCAPGPNGVSEVISALESTSAEGSISRYGCVWGGGRAVRLPWAKLLEDYRAGT